MRIVVCVTGASGSIYARRLLGVLSEAAQSRPDLDVRMVVTRNALEVWRQELGEDLPRLV